MQVYSQKSTRTIFPCSSCRVSGALLIHPLPPSKPASRSAVVAPAATTPGASVVHVRNAQSPGKRRNHTGTVIERFPFAGRLDFHLCVEVDVDRWRPAADRTVVAVRWIVALREQRVDLVGCEVVDPGAVVEVARVDGAVE